MKTGLECAVHAAYKCVLLLKHTIIVLLDECSLLRPSFFSTSGVLESFQGCFSPTEDSEASSLSPAWVSLTAFSSDSLFSSSSLFAVWKFILSLLLPHLATHFFFYAALSKSVILEATWIHDSLYNGWDKSTPKAFAHAPFNTPSLNCLFSIRSLPQNYIILISKCTREIVRVCSVSSREMCLRFVDDAPLSALCKIENFTLPRIYAVRDVNKNKREKESGGTTIYRVFSDLIFAQNQIAL